MYAGAQQTQTAALHTGTMEETVVNADGSDAFNKALDMLAEEQEMEMEEEYEFEEEEEEEEDDDLVSGARALDNTWGPSSLTASLSVTSARAMQKTLRSSLPVDLEPAAET